MSELTRPIRRLLGRGDRRSNPRRPSQRGRSIRCARSNPRPRRRRTIAVDIAESDPLLAYLQTAPGPVDLARLELDSPAVTALREAGGRAASSRSSRRAS